MFKNLLCYLMFISFCACTTAAPNTEVATLPAEPSRSPSAAKSELNYDCGMAYGKTMTLQIKSSPPGTAKTHVAEFMGPGKDSTTGTLVRSKVFFYQGESRPIQIVKGVVEDGYAFDEIGNSQRSLIIQKDDAPKIRKKYKALLLNLTRSTTDELECVLKSSRNTASE